MWTMPALESLPPPARSIGRGTCLVVLRVYLLLASVVVVVAVIERISS